MKAVVSGGIGDIPIEGLAEPKIQQTTDAIARLNSSATCGTDLHLVRGTASGLRRGAVNPMAILTNAEPLSGAIEAYDRRDPGWIELASARAAE